MEGERPGSRTAAAIYIGSNALQLKIGETHEGAIRTLDTLEYPLNLGQDTFSKGKISFEKAGKICEALEGFFRLIDDYQVEESCIVATIALRDAENKEYILDQIKVRTGKQVYLLDDAEEKKLIYKEMLKKLSEDKALNEGRALMTYIGTGSLGVALYDKGNIPFSHNIRIGPLKLNEVLDKIQEHDERSIKVVEEYLSTYTDTLGKDLPTKKMQYFVASGQEMDLIAKLCAAVPEGPLLLIQKERFDRLYQEIEDKTDEQMAKLYGITVENAGMLLPSMAIYKALLQFTAAEVIVDLAVNLLDGLLFQMLFPEKARQMDEQFAYSTVTAAQIIGDKYKYNQKHALAVHDYAVQLFDNTQSLHGLGKEERVLLEVASLLHDVGKYINSRGHAFHSYYIIKNSDIAGLNDRQTEIVGQLAMFHGKETPHLWYDSYSRLLPEEKAVVSKLVAILRIADALDRGHHQKFSALDVKLKQDKLIITGKTQQDTHIEQWALKRKGNFFEEVYGIKAEFHKKDI